MAHSFLSSSETFDEKLCPPTTLLKNLICSLKHLQPMIFERRGGRDVLVMTTYRPKAPVLDKALYIELAKSIKYCAAEFSEQLADFLEILEEELKCYDEYQRWEPEDVITALTDVQRTISRASLAVLTLSDGFRWAGVEGLGLGHEDKVKHPIGALDVFREKEWEIKKMKARFRMYLPDEDGGKEDDIGNAEVEKM